MDPSTGGEREIEDLPRTNEMRRLRAVAVLKVFTSSLLSLPGQYGYEEKGGLRIKIYRKMHPWASSGGV